MGFEFFKSNFIDYLEEKGRITFDKKGQDEDTSKTSLRSIFNTNSSSSNSKAKYYEDEDDVNIFNFTKDLKNFIEENPQQEGFYDNVKLRKLQNSTTEDGTFKEKGTRFNKDGDFYSGLLNEFLAQDDVKNYMGLNEDEEYSKEMLDAFLTVTNDLDDNKKFSIEDLFSAMDKIENDDEDYKKDLKETKETKEGKEADSTSSSSSASGGGGGYSSGGGGGGGSSSSSSSSSSTNQNQDTNPLDSMSSEQLEEEKTLRANNLTEAQTIFNAVNKGQTEAINAAQEKMKEDEQTYQEALEKEEAFNEEFKKEVKENSDAISESEQKIGELNNKLADQTVAYNNQTNLISSLEQEITALKTSKSQLETQIQSANSSSGIATAEVSSTTPTTTTTPVAPSTTTQTTAAQISPIPTSMTPSTPSTSATTASPSTSTANETASLENKLSEITTQITTKETALSEAKTKLQTMEAEKKQTESEIETENQKKTELEAKRTSIEESVMNNEKVSQATKDSLSTYQASRDTLTATKQEELAIANKLMTDALNGINEVENKISEVKAKEIVKETKPKTNIDDMFIGHSELVHEIVDQDGLRYLAVYPKDLDPNEEHPMLVYLHGSGERGANPERFLNRRTLQQMMEGSLDSFNGYFLIPVANAGWAGGNERTEATLRNAMNDFTSKHKVDKEQIALAGYSEGGGAAAYFGTHMKDVFRRTAIISGIPTQGVSQDDYKDTNQIKGYGFSRGDGGASNYFGDDNFVVLTGANHSTAPERAFNDDNDGNNRSDMLEWLFSDKDEPSTPVATV